MPSGNSISLLDKLLMRGSKKKRERALVDEVRTRFERGILHRRQYEREWNTNIHFYAGNQWGEVDGSTAFALRAKKKPTWGERTTQNRVLPLIHAAMSLLIGGKDEYRAIPSSSSDRDRTAAKLGDQITKRAWKMFDLPEKKQEFALWMLCAGICGMDVQWDPQAGPLAPIPLLDPMTQEAMYDDNQEPMVEEDGRGNVRWDNIGDVSHVIVPPMNFLPDPFAVNPRDCKDYIYHVPRSLDYIRQRWPDSSKDVVAEDLKQHGSGEHSLSGYFGLQGTTESDQDVHEFESGATVIQWTVAPRPGFPTGGTVWIAGDVLLEVSEGLDEHCLRGSHLGLFMARCFQVPGRFWPASAVDQLRPSQKALNLTLSQIFEAKNQTMAGKWLVPRPANIAPGSLNRKPGERVPYDPPFAPTYAQPSPIPRYVMDIAEKLPYWMQELNRTHQATLGQAPQNLRSGVAISEVQEQDEVGWSVTGNELDRCFEKVTGRTLFLMQQRYVGLPRLLPLLNEETGEWDVQDFLGSDLAGINDVELVPGSTRRRSRARMQAFLMELLASNAGAMLMAEPDMVARVMESLDLGNIATVLDHYEADAAEAREEFKVLDNLDEQQLMMLQAYLAEGENMQPPDFLPNMQAYQNAQVHLKNHGDDLKKPSTRHGDPAVFLAKLAHFNTTLSFFISTMPEDVTEDEQAPKKAPKKAAKKPSSSSK